MSKDKYWETHISYEDAWTSSKYRTLFNRRKETYYESLWGLEIWGSRQLRKSIGNWDVPSSWLRLLFKYQFMQFNWPPKINRVSVQPVWVIQINISFYSHISQIFLALIAAGWEWLWGKSYMWEIYWNVSSRRVEKKRITIRQKKLTCCTFITEALSHFSGKVVNIITVASIWCTVRILDI